MSSGWILPRSPWVASAGCRKWLGVPVEARVALNFLAMCPDLPRPETMTLPVQSVMVSTACVKDGPRRSASCWMAAASSARTCLAKASGESSAVVCGLGADCWVDLGISVLGRVCGVVDGG